MKFSWQILEMRKDGAGVVTQVWFRLTGRESGRQQSLQGSITLASPGEGAELTGYADLTEKQVIGWVKAHPAAEDFKQRVAKALHAPEAEAVADKQALPWAPDGGNA
jgi:hypothetical protein